MAVDTNPRQTSVWVSTALIVLAAISHRTAASSFSPDPCQLASPLIRPTDDDNRFRQIRDETTGDPYCEGTFTIAVSQRPARELRLVQYVITDRPGLTLDGTWEIAWPHISTGGRITIVPRDQGHFYVVDGRKTPVKPDFKPEATLSFEWNTSIAHKLNFDERSLLVSVATSVSELAIAESHPIRSELDPGTLIYLPTSLMSAMPGQGSNLETPDPESRVSVQLEIAAIGDVSVTQGRLTFMGPLGASPDPKPPEPDREIRRAQLNGLRVLSDSVGPLRLNDLRPMSLYRLRLSDASAGPNLSGASLYFVTPPAPPKAELAPAGTRP